MLVCLRLKRLDRGLSIVEAEDPDTRDGVRVFVRFSGFGKREELVDIVPPWRGPRITGAFGVGALWPVTPLAGCASSLEGLLFFSFDGPGVGT